MTVDCLGRPCPVPVIELAKALVAVEIGDVVEVLSDDPAARLDIPAWCRMRGHTYLGDPENRQQIYPDYVAIAKGFNVPAERVMFKKDLRAALQRMLDSDQPYVLDVIVPYTEHVLPFIPAGKTVADMIWQA